MLRITTGPLKGRTYASEQSYRRAYLKLKGKKQVRGLKLPKGTIQVGAKRPAPVRRHYGEPTVVLQYYLIEVLDTSGGRRKVTLIRYRGEPPLTDAEVDRRVKEFWASLSPYETYEGEVLSWRILAIIIPR